MKPSTLVLAFLLFAPVVVSAQESGLPQFPFLHAKGRAEKRVPPNMATLNFQILVHHQNSEAALAAFWDIEKRLVDGLTKAGVDAKDITAGGLKKEIIRERDTNYNNREILGYDFVRTFSVVARDLKGLERITEIIMSTTNTGDVETEFDHAERVAIEKQLTQEACKNARDNADRIASGFGMKVASVYGISDGGIGPMVIRMRNRREGEVYGAAAMDSSGGMSHSIPEYISISEGVDALFVITEAK